MALASLDQLEAVCGPPDDPEAAERALGQATTIIQSFTGQWLLPVDGATVTVDTNGSWLLLLPELPVRAVHEVTVAGKAFDSADYEWSANGKLRLRSCSCGGHGVCGCWPPFPDAYQTVTVTYDHGFDPVPDDLALAAAQMACRILHGGVAAATAADVTSETIGSYSVRYGTPGLTASEEFVLGRYRL